MRNVLLIFLLLLLVACNGGQDTAEPHADATRGTDAGTETAAAGSPADEASADAAVDRGPEETGAREARDYEPAFDNQTRAPKPAEFEAWKAETVAEEWLEIGHRVRDVIQGPDDLLYLVTDASDGRVMRILPDAG